MLSTCILCSATVDSDASLAWHKDGLDIVRCPVCGLVFRADPPDEDVLGEIYDEDYFRDQPDRASRHGYSDYLRDAPLHRANARRRLRQLAARIPKRGRLLDVGCAGGFFVDEAQRAGWEASGIDVSAAMVAWATDELGVSVTRGSFANPEVILPQFDAVTMWDYIEHSIDPRADFVKAHDHLTPGGVLALSTGDIGTLSARLTGSRWHLLTPEHHNVSYTTKTLSLLIESTGFADVEARHRASLYSIAHVLYKLETLAPLDAIRRGAARVGRSSVGASGVPLNLYDIVTIVARRR